MKNYDIIILGGGSAGIVSGVAAGALKMRTLIVERSRLGGECLHTGCVPSKALLHAARTARVMRSAAEIGLKNCSLNREDAKGVLAWVRQRVQQVCSADACDELLRQNSTEVRIGQAHFQDAHTLIVEGEPLRASHFILATGSRPAIPAIAGLSEACYLTNQTLWNLDAIPESLLVVGGGPVGVEMAQAFQLLGSRVTLITRNARLLPRDDQELSRELEGLLRGDGLDIRCGVSLNSLVREGSICHAEVGGERVSCHQLLLATGRVPNVEGLNLAAAGVRVEADRVPTDAYLRTSAPHIYACGDVNGVAQFSHMAEFQAKAAVRNIVLPGKSKALPPVLPWTTFSEPELAHAGLTEEEARKKRLSFEIFRQPFAQNDRALTDNESRGLIKVLSHSWTGKILGVHILGPRAGELLQEWLGAMAEGKTLRQVGDQIHVYPTLSMINQHVAQRWYERKVRWPPLQWALRAYARWRRKQ